MLTALRSRLRELLDERAARHADLDAITEAAEAEARTDLTDDEAARFAELRAAIGELDDQAADVRARIADLEALDESRSAAADALEALADVDPAAPAPAARPAEVRVTSEPGVYHPGSSASFFADLVNRRHDLNAEDRLRRHASAGHEVELRDGTTSNYAGLVPPQYLTAAVAEYAHAGRPTLNLATAMPLPASGNTVNISKVTTATSVAAQATENAAASETDLDDTLLTVNVRTFAGQQDVSRQVIERGVGTDGVIMRDLARAYATKVNASAIADDGTSGTHLGILNATGTNSVSYTDASPTVAEFMPKLFDAVQQIETALGTLLSDDLVTVMHPRRWAWLLAAVDGQNRPLVLPAQHAPQNAAGVGGSGYGRVVGTVGPGVPVVTDASVPTNLGGGTEDAVIVAARSELFVWEDTTSPPVVRYDEVGSGNLTVKFVTYGYSAFTAERRPAAVSKITGTGLAAPTF